MTENEWTRIIADKLSSSIAPLTLSTQQKIPYLQEIESYSIDWIPNYRAPDSFETDMAIYEQKDSVIIPTVIIEAKIKTVTTHDAITYSRKAELHKNVMPFLRYGIMLGTGENILCRADCSGMADALISCSVLKASVRNSMNGMRLWK